MKIHRSRAFSLGSGIAIGLVMLALSPSPSLTAQKHHRQHAHHLSVQPRSSSYRFGPGPAQELSPEAAAMANAQKSWPGQPLCDDVWLPNSSVQSPWGWGPVIDPGRFTPLPDLPRDPKLAASATRAKEKQRREPRKNRRANRIAPPPTAVHVRCTKMRAGSGLVLHSRPRQFRSGGWDVQPIAAVRGGGPIHDHRH